MRVADLGEHALLERIRARVPPPPSFVVVGIGDDAAVLEPPRNALDVLTTDSLVAGVHFDPAYTAPADIGYKALAVNLSDLAAMGATPRAALLSLMLPDDCPVTDVDELVDGVLDLARGARCAVVGGNIARSPGPLIVDITVTGSARRRRVLTRGGARAGDLLYVSGALGESAAGLASLQASRDTPTAPRAPACEARHLRPVPRLRLGGLLGRTRTASACVDLSDGLADGVRQLAHASALGAIIDAPAIPIGAAARDWFARTETSAIEATLQGGEDYELLFAVPPRRRRQLADVQRHVGGLPLTPIGRLVSAPRLELTGQTDVAEFPAGFTHFAKARPAASGGIPAPHTAADTA